MAGRARRSSTQGGARPLRRGARQNSRPRRQGKERRSRQLSVARARRRAEISAAAIAGRRRVIAAAGFDQEHAARVVRCRQGARHDHLRPRQAVRWRRLCRPRHRRAVRRHDGRAARLARLCRSPRQSHFGADGLNMVDAITTQVVRNRIGSLMQEMHYHFYRSGYSTIIRESRDFSCVILDRHGGVLVAPPMFFHAPVYRHLVAKIFALHGDDIGDGDMFVCNHPYDGGLPHVSDMAFVSPIISGTTLVGFAGSIAHKADVGGTNPGSTSANATEIFQEGLLLPPVKIYSGGVFNGDLERLILANSRQPELVGGDMHAQMAATQMGAERIRQTCAQFGVAPVMEAFAALLKGAAEELRAAVKALPDGESSTEGFMDNDGVELDRPVRFAVTVRVKNGEIEFDFSNSDRQARGPVNLRPSMVEACVFYCLIGALGPKLHFNDGMREVVRFKYAPNTVTNASTPAPVSSYQAANLKLTDVILEALAPFRPERAVANGGASGAMLISWKEGG